MTDDTLMAEVTRNSLRASLDIDGVVQGLDSLPEAVLIVEERATQPAGFEVVPNNKVIIAWRLSVHTSIKARDDNPTSPPTGSAAE